MASCQDRALVATVYITIGMIMICMAYVPDWQVPVMVATVLPLSYIIETCEE